ncbi:hypothetical protein [Thioclava sp. GXIMD4216]|uniref:hypothetical protein n=1 Tax=Thioclava sp. GXIMD4216 TaxID=3131929 RepID=UPI0030D2F1B8
MTDDTTDFSKPEDETEPKRAPTQPVGRPPMQGPPARSRSIYMILIVFLAVLTVPVVSLVAVLAWAAVTHHPMRVPMAITTKVEARVNQALGGTLQARFSGGADLVIASGLRPQVRLNSVQLLAPSGRPIAVLPQVQAAVLPMPLLQRRIALSSIELKGAAVAMRRLSDGSLDINFGGQGEMQHLAIDSLSDVTDAVEAAFATPVLQDLSEIRADTIDIRLDDERLGRVWRVSKGQFRLTQEADRISASLSLNVGEQNDMPAQLALGVTTYKNSPRAQFGAAVTGVPARDLAVQSPALAGLSVLDAPISGSLQTAIDDQGVVSGMVAKLNIGAGALSPVEGSRPIPFESAALELSYNQKQQRIEMSRLEVHSTAAAFKATGSVMLRDFANGLPRQLVTQVALNDLQLDPEGVLEQPAHFSDGMVDLRIGLDPFRVDIGQAQLMEDQTRLSAKGSLAASSKGWQVSLDSGISRISSKGLLALWPPKLVEHTRKWADENIADGTLYNVRAAIRIAPNHDPRIDLGYEFSGADVRAVKTLPNIEDGRGFATLDGTTYAMMVEEGQVTAPDGGAIEVADSTLKVPNIKLKPAPMQVDLVTRSQIPAALSLLDEPPFSFMSKAGKGTDIAKGWAVARTHLEFPLQPHLKPTDFKYDVSATLTDVYSDQIVPGKVLRSRQMRLLADPEKGLRIGGRGLFQDQKFDAWWIKKFTPEEAQHSQVQGYLNITPEGLTKLGVALPDNILSGEGWAALDLDMVTGEPVRYVIRSDMKGIGLSIPQISWRKGQASSGKLSIAGELSQPVKVDRISLDVPGLKAEGSVALRADGEGLERASFDRLSIGGWFNGAADLIGKGRNRPPGVAIRGGRLTLSDLPSGTKGAGSGSTGGGSTGGGASASTPLSVRLDRLLVTDGIELTDLVGQFNTRAGFNGTFDARLNGGAVVSGAVGPSASGRPAVRVETRDAGGVLASAKLFDNARGGQMVLNLSPMGDRSYVGQLRASNLKITNAPILASMLSAASIVGLLEQLTGDGIVFNNASADFKLTPQGVSVTEGRATGASMGITLNGNYHIGSGAFDMEGVISPLYIVNGIGQILSRRGEGLFGFTYTLRGSKTAPKVSINPLSIFTPGMFRNLFRTDPPALSTE